MIHHCILWKQRQRDISITVPSYACTIDGLVQESRNSNALAMDLVNPVSNYFPQYTIMYAYAIMYYQFPNLSSPILVKGAPSG